MALPLRVKNTAYFDIAPTPSTSASLGSPNRPLAGGYSPKTRPTSQQGQAAAMPAREMARVGEASPGRPGSTSGCRAQLPLREGAGQSDDTERRARSVPAQWKEEFTAASAAFFTEGEEPLGSPRGAANVGPG